MQVSSQIFCVLKIPWALQLWPATIFHCSLEYTSCTKFLPNLKLMLDLILHAGIPILWDCATELFCHVSNPSLPHIPLWNQILCLSPAQTEFLPEKQVLSSVHSFRRRKKGNVMTLNFKHYYYFTDTCFLGPRLNFSLVLLTESSLIMMITKRYGVTSLSKIEDFLRSITLSVNVSKYMALDISYVDLPFT